MDERFPTRRHIAESCWLHDVRTLATRDFVTRLHERGSLALSLIRLSGETRAHRSPSARPAFLTVRRLLYSNGFLPPFSSAEFCSAYLTLMARSPGINLFITSILLMLTLPSTTIPILGNFSPWRHRFKCRPFYSIIRATIPFRLTTPRQSMTSKGGQ